MSKQPDMLSMDANRQQPILAETVQIYEHLYLAHTTDLAGLNVARSDGKEPKFYGDRPWFLGAKSGAKVTRQTLIGRTSNEPALCVSSPIYNNLSSILGAVAICTDLTDLAEQVGAVRLGKTGYAFLVNDAGQVLAHPSPEFSSELKDLSTYPPVKAVLQGDNKVFEFSDEADIQWLAYGIPLASGWGIVVQQQVSEVLQKKQTYWRLSVTVAAFATLGVSALAWLLASQMLRPISYLTHAATGLAEGDLTQQVKIHSRDELGALAVAFNSMAQQLRTSFAALKETNEALEQRVKHRTAELETVLMDLKQTQSQMLHSEKMSALGQMVAGVAHEINNPVNFIHGNLSHLSIYTHDLITFLRLYEKHYPNPVGEIQEQAKKLDIDFVREDLENILSSMKIGTERIQEIVLSLRNFSRLDEAGYKAVNIHEGLESTLLLLAHRLEHKADQAGIHIVRDFGNLPLIECFAGQLNQVFMNILVNCIEALESEQKGNYSGTNNRRDRIVRKGTAEGIE